MKRLIILRAVSEHTVKNSNRSYKYWSQIIAIQKKRRNFWNMVCKRFISIRIKIYPFFPSQLSPPHCFWLARHQWNMICKLHWSADCEKDNTKGCTISKKDENINGEWKCTVPTKCAREREDPLWVSNFVTTLNSYWDTFYPVFHSMTLTETSYFNIMCVREVWLT